MALEVTTTCGLLWRFRCERLCVGTSARCYYCVTKPVLFAWPAWHVRTCQAARSQHGMPKACHAGACQWAQPKVLGPQGRCKSAQPSQVDRHSASPQDEAAGNRPRDKQSRWQCHLQGNSPKQTTKREHWRTCRMHYTR